jgi:hypothetical protein
LDMQAADARRSASPSLALQRDANPKATVNLCNRSRSDSVL